MVEKKASRLVCLIKSLHSLLHVRLHVFFRLSRRLLLSKVKKHKQLYTGNVKTRRVTNKVPVSSIGMTYAVL